MKLTLDRQYRAGSYTRLSKEDSDLLKSGEKSESNSISSQRLLIREYLKQCPEITLVKEYCDDGFSGANFERPQFQKMMEDVKAGVIDCIIVKDLSRFGREYIDAGNYLQKIFPALGVRFIAINDGYDNAKPGAAENDLILPFKNLMNDSYCRDISIKIRTNLEAKRRSGQFVGSRVVYGYKRDPENKNKLVVDPQAAQVVQDIFRWKLEGMSPAQIAECLNQAGVLSPIEYKKANGSKQRTVFQTKKQALWSAVAIYRILSNVIYTGTLVQGKTTTPNHKVKKTVRKDPSEWSRTEQAHEAIISSAQFDIVQNIMQEDTRRPIGAATVHPFSGKVFCAECGSAMTRKVVRFQTKEYAYLICSGNKADKNLCSSNRIREDTVYHAVLAVLQTHIRAALKLEDALEQIDQLAWENRELKKIEGKIAVQQEIMDKNRRLLTDAYEDFRSQFITREEYETFKVQFNRNLSEAQKAMEKLIEEQNSIQCGLSQQQGWLGQFRQYENIREITRSVVVHLIERVAIHKDQSIDVVLRHQDQFAAIFHFLQEREDTEHLHHSKKEAV